MSQVADRFTLELSLTTVDARGGTGRSERESDDISERGG